MDKNVAILCTLGSAVLASLKKVLSTISDLDERIIYYENYRSLVQDILDGKVIGIISLHENTEGIIRHDLKNMGGWKINEANFFPLPPIKELLDVTIVVASAITTITEMLENTFVMPNMSERFNFEENLPRLRNLMRPVQQPIHVSIVDDSPDEVECIIRLLEIWPGDLVRDTTFVGEIDLDANGIAEAISAQDILLLDERLGMDLRGTQIAKAVIDMGHNPILASISGGDKPKFTKHHFHSKKRMDLFRGTAEQFISLMNNLIKIKEQG